VHDVQFPPEVVQGLAGVRGGRRVTSLRALLIPKNWNEELYLRSAPRRRRLAACLAAWVDRQPLQAPNYDGLAPGCSEAALRAWTSPRGIEPWRDAPPPTEVSYAGATRTIGDLIVGHHPDAWACLRWLLARADDVAAGSVDEQSLPRSPADPRLGAIFDRLTSLRTRLRTRFHPPRQAATHLTPGPAHALVIAVEHPWPHHPARGHVDLDLDLASTRCGCAAECPWQLGSVDAVLRWLGSPLDETTVRALLAPAWRRRLQALRDLAARPETDQVPLVVVVDDAGARLHAASADGAPAVHDALPVHVPPEAVPELLAQLSELRRLGPIAIAAEEVAADPRPLVSLRAGAEHLDVEIGVLPLRFGDVHPIGSGPQVVYAVGASRLRAATRSFVTERYDYMNADFGLPDDGPWRLTDPDQIASLIDRLDKLGDRIQVRWRGPPLSTITPLPADLSFAATPVGPALQLTGALRAGSLTVPIEVLLAALRLNKNTIRVGGTLVRLTAPWIARLRDLARVADGDHVSVAHHPVLRELQDRIVTSVTEEMDDLRARMVAATEIPFPTSLVAKLRPYQRDGIRFLLDLTWAPGALLCDDMGLGKTVQALGVLLARAADGPALVVAPTSLVVNWQREAATFAPSLRWYAGGRRPTGAPTAGDVVIVTWDALARGAASDLAFATVVFDEAHVAKNPNTLRAQAARAVRAAFRLVISGTPIENRLADLWSLVEVAIPGLLGSQQQFRDRFALPITLGDDADARRQLSEILVRFVLRRRKRDVAPDLPTRTEVVVPIPLSETEQRLYDDAAAATALLLGRAGSSSPMQRFHVLAALTSLRQLACHPRLRHPDGPAGSAKLDYLRDLCVALREQGDRVLVFSQFVALLALARAALEAEGLRVCMLTGADSAQARQSEVDAFQRGDAEVFLISLKAGGTGLNLVAANYVVHLDPWWNPAAEAQAADRAHRIGQHRPVTIYKLVASGTVEEQIVRLQDHKRELMRAVFDGDAAATPTLEELRDLIAPATTGTPGAGP
jgi:superfamily II DNA or RNA helicase